MKLLNKFFKKGESEEEHFEIDENGNRIDGLEYQSSKEPNYSIVTIINKLSLEEAYNAKELIEKRLEELHNQYGLTDNTKAIGTNFSARNNITRQITEEQIEQKVDDDFLNDETMEIDGNMIVEDEYFEVKEEPKVQEIENEPTPKKTVENIKPRVEPKPQPTVEQQTIPEPKETIVQPKVEETKEVKEVKKINPKEVNEQEIFNKLKTYFGQENIFQETRNDLRHEVLQNKEVYCIGIRSREAFSDESFDILKQNSWFIRNIKQLDELKSFKMISSSNVEKNLVWDKGEYAILISYKAINLLKSMNEFNFN